MATAPDQLELPATVGIGEAEALHGDLVARLAAGGTILVDGSSVERITTPAIQVMLACARTCTTDGDGVRFAISAASDSMRDAFRLLGLEAELDGWMAASTGQLDR